MMRCLIVEHYKKKELAEGFGKLKRYRVLKQGRLGVEFLSKQSVVSGQLSVARLAKYREFDKN
jgi:hypothetical protein